ncbi:Rsn1p [Sugiyamaella lignohabitans]|uniref:Rsn1p n=1 Tax=Sugiyamaella lignohabitans TaxID=796027 RepID=A0A167ET38_9ASCO|nr:Rsn1p [Sugiyamaella lignohabitans]ANB14423.1 Rsn1p [Sugiyamaella lignohabitans]
MGGSSSSSTSSGSTIGTTAVFNIAVFVIFVTAFLILRPRHKNVYQPRVIAKTVPDSSRPRPLATGNFVWFRDLLSRPDSEILRDAGLDGYFFLRYLRLIFFICLVGIILVYPVLLAVNATGGGTPQGVSNSGFDILSFVNVRNKNRYFAHVFIGYLFFGFILFSLYRELQYYVAVRQSVLTSPAYSNLVSSRTILLTTLPDEYMNSSKLANLFEGVKFVFINKNAKDLAKKVKQRGKLAGNIESAEVSLLKKAVSNRLKSEKKGASPIEGEDIDVYVPQKKRPTRRLKPIIGKKVDTIDHDSQELQEVNTEIEQLQSKYTSLPSLNSAFITFHTQEQAELGYQSLAHQQALHMAPRYIGITPDDVIWSNLRLKWWERLIKELGTTAIICALIIFWSIPVAFVGALSNIKALEKKLPWLDFLNNLPKPLMGLVTGLLPTILLAVLMMLLPIFIRLMGKLAGNPSKSRVEYYTQNAYFGFQVVQVFLVTTIASGASAVVVQIIEDPSSAMSLLATNLPKASNFYIAYFMLQGFTACGSMLLQIVSLILFYVLGFILDGTPRKKWNRNNVIGSLGWGTVFPVYTNLAVITITYSIISPLLLAFSGITFGLIYLAYLHNLMFVKSPSDGRGIYYARAILQTFTGLYIAEVCLLGLFLLAKSWGPLVLQAIFLGFTVFVNLSLKSAFSPLLFQLPRSLLRAEARDDNRKYSRSSAGSVIPSPDTSFEKNHNDAHPSSYPLTNEPSNAPIVNQSQVEAGRTKYGPIPSGGTIARFFKPHLYLTPEVLNQELLNAPVFHEPQAPLSDEEESVAYNHPAANAPNPVVWIPRDPWGLSAAQVQSLRERDVNVSDDGTWFDIDETKKKSKFGFTSSISEVPIWTQPPNY